MITQQKTTNALEHVSGTVVSLAASLKHAHDGLSEMSKRQVKELATETERRNAQKKKATNLSSHINKFDGLFCVWRCKEDLAVTRVRRLRSHQWSVSDNLQTLGKKLPCFRSDVFEILKHVFMEFRPSLARPLPVLSAARHSFSVDHITHKMGLLQEIIVALEEKMTVAPRRIASNSGVFLQGNLLVSNSLFWFDEVVPRPLL